MAANSPLPAEPDVLIVGAGPVGLTVAAELARHGARVRLVDKRDGPVTYSQAAAVHVRMQEILGAMGIVDGWLAAGHRFERLTVRAFGKKIGTMHPGGVDSPYPAPLIIGQNVTERLIVEHAERLGVRVERKVSAIGYTQYEDNVRVTLQYPEEGGRKETVRVPWVVACEGSSSLARDTAGIQFEGARYTGQEFVQADARMHWSYPNGDAYSFVNKERTLLLLPFDAHGRYRVLCARPERADSQQGPPTLDEMQTIAREMTGDPGLRLSDPLWLNRFRTQHRLAARFREGRIFIAGDAGHVHVPIGGQGMNYGVQDAFNLAWKLAAVVRGDARPEPFLGSYNAERHRVDADLLHGTDEGFRAMVNPSAWKQFAMRLVGPMALGSETIQERVKGLLSGTKVHYQGSPLAEDHGGSAGPVAGDRAPDAPVVALAERETVHLFQLLYPTGRWTLLLFGGLEPTEAGCLKLATTGAEVLTDFGRMINAHFILTDLEIAGIVEGGSVLMDREHLAHEKYGVKHACIYLVRPDGYVGFRGGAEHGGELLAYLYRVGLIKA